MGTFLTGLGMGLAIGIIAAPKRGAESRQALGRLAKDTVDTAVAEGRDRATRAVRAARENAPEALAPMVDRAAELLNVEAGETQGQSQGQRKPPAKQTGDAGNINLIAREDLLAIYGIGPILAARIIEGRPYRSLDEVGERGILNEQTVAELRRELQKRSA